MQKLKITLVLKTINNSEIQLTKENLKICFDNIYIKAVIDDIINDSIKYEVFISIEVLPQLKPGTDVKLWFIINDIPYNGKVVIGKTNFTTLRVIDNFIDLNNSTINADNPYIFSDNLQPNNQIKGSLNIPKNTLYVKR